MKRDEIILPTSFLLSQHCFAVILFASIPLPPFFGIIICPSHILFRFSFLQIKILQFSSFLSSIFIKWTMREQFAVERAKWEWENGKEEKKWGKGKESEHESQNSANECRIDLEWLSNCSTSFFPFLWSFQSFPRSPYTLSIRAHFPFHSPLSHLASCGIHRMTKCVVRRKNHETKWEEREREESKFRRNHATVIHWTVNSFSSNDFVWWKWRDWIPRVKMIW